MEKRSENKVKVSVCISVHNTAKYLPRCLDSVCAQTLQDLEIVIVNNGSTDNSEDIMYEYKNAHPERRFVIISQEDRSLAGGRQSGIDNASGEYLAFLDADDLVEPVAYEKMLECAEREQVDIVEIQTLRDGVVLGSNMIGRHNTHDVLRQYFRKEGIQSMLWLRLYKKSLFKKNVLPTIYTNNEDMFAMPCLLHAAKSIFFLNEPLHIYSTDNEGGVMKSETFNPELAEKRFQSRQKALLAIPHFRNFVGEDDYAEYANEHCVHEAVYIMGFLLVDFIGKSMNEKENAVINALDFKSKREMNMFLHQHLPHTGSKSYLIYRLFGINFTYCFYRIINKIIKR